MKALNFSWRFSSLASMLPAISTTLFFYGTLITNLARRFQLTSNTDNASDTNLSVIYVNVLSVIYVYVLSVIYVYVLSVIYVYVLSVIYVYVLPY